MHILSPVDSPAEAARLASLGARELYGGYLDPDWERRFTLAASANRRSFPEAQIRGETQLRGVVRACHREGASFLLTANSPFYTAEQFGPLLDTVAMAVDAGVDGIIAADIGLILEARRRWPGVPVHLSSLAEVTNGEAAAFYGDLGVGRITLPRHLSLREIEGIVTGSPGVEFDVFVLYGQCPNAEGFCTFSHDHPRRIWPCVQNYRISRGGNRRGGKAKAHPLCGQMLWGGINRGEACGLCALWDLGRIGITGLKVVGRGTSSGRKEWAVGTLSRLLGLLEGQPTSREEFLRAARAAYRERFTRGCRPTHCYFPELLEGRDG